MSVIDFIRDFRMLQQLRDEAQNKETARHEREEEHIYEQFTNGRINLAKKYNLPENLIP